MFRCSSCERQLPTARLSSTRLINRFGRRELLCTSCEDFLSLKLPFLVDRVESKNLGMLKTDTPSGEPPRYKPMAAPMTKMSADSKLSRRPSSMEQDAFRYHSLSVERFIDGFIIGLESAGIDRTTLPSSAEKAVNNLLDIRQTLVQQRGRVQQLNRSDIRRLNRHLKETVLLVEEYVRAVTEEFAKSER